MRKLIDLSGRRFGKWLVLRRFGTNSKTRWLCRCDCGNEKDIEGSSLKRGNSQSCGCDRGNKIRDWRTKHGMSSTKEHHSWRDMLRRCQNPKYPQYENYGGRGISVCDRWLESFENFLEDMGECPVGLTLERIDVNGNYEPSNCKWENRANQNYNQRKRKDNTSGRVGVYWIKRRHKWLAAIGVGGEFLHLGFFLDFDDAVRAREEAELKYYGYLKE